jgi:hypothetical protein
MAVLDSLCGNSRRKGLNWGGMQTKLAPKIEELTLRMIQETGGMAD